MNQPIKKKIKIYSYTAVAGILLVMSSMIFSSCMETTTPENNNNYNLTVKVFQLNPQSAQLKIPLRNVNISIDDPAGISPQMNGLTNDQGLATFRLNVPLIGSNFNITANYNNKIQTKSRLLICRDTLVVFLFDTANAPVINCNSLNGNDSLIFIDDNGSRRLVANTPVGINKYDGCLAPIQVDANNGEPVIATLPQLNSDVFKLSMIMLDTQVLPLNTTTVTIPPGSSLVLCFTASTNVAPGTYNQPYVVNLRCAAAQGNFTRNLRADIVAPECTCENLATQSYDFVLPNRVQTGSTADHSEVVFTSNFPCNVQVSQASFDNGNGAWTILSPAFPLTLKKGETININARFSPKKAGVTAGRLRLNIRPEGSTTDCPYDVNLSSEGCSPSCPLFSTDRSSFAIFNPRKIIDTLSNRNDNRVFVSTIDRPSRATRTYYVMNPDSACAEITVNIAVTPADNYAQQYFDVTPRTLRLAPGELGSIDVTFTAPIYADFQQITAARGNTKRITDSLFKISVQLSSPNCNQNLEINSVVTTFPDISPIINLRAYNQRTPRKSEPENEVYNFGDDARTILKGAGGAPGPFPPNKGDIFIDVNNNDPSANPPQEPILKLVDNAIGMKVFRTNYPESGFTNVPNLIADFLGSDFSNGYSTNPLTNLQVGDVIAFKINSSTYALIYIRRVDNGTENTSSKQSGIEFRSVYPIFIP